MGALQVFDAGSIPAGSTSSSVNYLLVTLNATQIKTKYQQTPVYPVQPTTLTSRAPIFNESFPHDPLRYAFCASTCRYGAGPLKHYAVFP